jgi:hypothetical protein
LIACAALFALGVSAFPTAAQELDEAAEEAIQIPPQEVQDVLAALQSDSTTGRMALAEYLKPELGDPSALADKAVGLVRRLRGDPVESLSVATVIAEVAGEAFYARPIVRAAVDPNFALPKGAMGWDLGPPDGPLVKGFQRLSESDPRLSGDNLSSLRRPGADAMTTDGIVGVRRVTLEVPAGAFRLVLVTDDLSRTTTIAAPLGDQVVINGRRHLIMQPGPQAWTGFGSFTNDPAAPLVPTEAPTGGSVVLDLDLQGGQIDIALPFAEGSPTFLTAIVLEPVDQPSTFQMTPETRAELDALLVAAREAESRLASAIADLLAGVATAAGIEERVALLQLDQLPLVVEDLLSVSPE